MALRILWDKFETALLIDTWIQIEKGEVPRQKAVADLSKLLRKRAVDQGICIDETYRNENGITLQLDKIHRLMNHLPDAEKHNTKLFVEMVNLFFSDRVQFDSILREAKGESSQMKGKEELFADWLRANVIPDRYTDYLSAITEIETFSQKKKIISGSIYNVTDPRITNRIVKAISADRIYQFFHRKQIQNIIKAARKFHIYVTENAKRKTLGNGTATVAPNPGNSVHSFHQNNLSTFSKPIRNAKVSPAANTIVESSADNASEAGTTLSSKWTEELEIKETPASFSAESNDTKKESIQEMEPKEESADIAPVVNKRNAETVSSSKEESADTASELIEGNEETTSVITEESEEIESVKIEESTDTASVIVEESEEIESIIIEEDEEAASAINEKGGLEVARSTDPSSTFIESEENIPAPLLDTVVVEQVSSEDTSKVESLFSELVNSLNEETSSASASEDDSISIENSTESDPEVETEDSASMMSKEHTSETAAIIDRESEIAESEQSPNDLLTADPIVESFTDKVPETRTSFSAQEDTTRVEGFAESEMDDKSALLADISRDRDFSFTKPLSVSYFGETYAVTSWRKLYVKVCEMLIEDYPSVFSMLRDAPASDAWKLIIFDGKTSKSLTAPVCIAEGYYIETNRSASFLMRNIKLLLEACLVDYENLEIRYKRINNSRNYVQNRTESENSDYKTAKDPIIEYLEDNGIPYIDQRNKSGRLWLIGAFDIADTIITLSNAGVSLHYKMDGSRSTAWKPAWWTLDKPKSLNLKNHITDAENTSEQNKSLTFSDWLSTQSLTEPNIKAILQIFPKVDEYAVKYRFVSDSLYAIRDPYILEKIWDKLNRKEDFVKFSRKYSVVANAFDMYIRYVEENNIPSENDAHPENEPLNVRSEQISSDVQDDEYEAKESFRKWMIKHGYLRATALGYTSAVSIVDEYARKNRFTTDSIFLITDNKEILSIWKQLQMDVGFSAYDQRKHNRFTTAMKKYIAFRNEEKHNPDSDIERKRSKQIIRNAEDTPLNNDQLEFKNWLSAQLLSDSTIRVVLASVTKISKYSAKYKLITNSFFSEKDCTVLEEVWKQLNDREEFAEFCKNRLNNYAFYKYLQFRRSKGTVSDKNVRSNRVSNAPRIEQISSKSQNNAKETQNLFSKSRNEDHVSDNANRAKNYTQISKHPAQAEFESWLMNNNTPKGSVKTYSQAVERIGNYLLDTHQENRHIFSIFGISRLEEIRIKLIKDQKYADMVGQGSVSLDSYAIRKYISFRKNDRSDAVDDTTFRSYSIILKKYFDNGFRVNSIIDRNRFKHYYSDLYNEEIPQSDEQMIEIMKQIGELQDDRVIMRDVTSRSDLLDDIQAAISLAFDNGASCIYLSAVFDRYQNQLASQLQIYNEEVLRQQLLSTSYDAYRATKQYFFRKRNPDITADVQNVMEQSPVPLNYEQIHDILWYLPVEQIKMGIKRSNEIVKAGNKTYFFAPNFPVNAEELEKIGALMRNQLVQKSFITDAELRELINRYCPSVAINTESFTTLGLKNALIFLMQDQFFARGTLIGEKGKEINIPQAFEAFCESHEEMTLDELKEFSDEMNTTVNWDSVFKKMLRISQKEFVKKSSIEFNISDTDAVLDQYVEGDYIPISNFALFLHLPAVSVKWNKFLLEGYVAQYSHNFTLLHAGYAADDCCGAIVRKDSSINNFDDLIVDVLAHADNWQSQDDALSLLVGKGYLNRRSYRKIETAISEARMYKNTIRADAQ